MTDNPTKQVGLRLPDDILSRIDRMAARQLRTRANMIEFLLRKALLEEPTVCEDDPAPELT